MKAFVMYVPLEVVKLTILSDHHDIKGDNSRQLSNVFFPGVLKFMEIHSISRRKVTLMFMDIANFTTLCENISPEDLIHMMSEYLSSMCSIITSSEGTVDKVASNFFFFVVLYIIVIYNYFHISSFAFDF